MSRIYEPQPAPQRLSPDYWRDKDIQSHNWLINILAAADAGDDPRQVLCDLIEWLQENVEVEEKEV